MEENIVLQVENLNVDFDNERVLEDLSFSLAEKELLVILGPNGAGKSTLLKTLLGLIPCQGQIQWKKDVHIGYVPNEFIIPEHLPLSLREFFSLKRILRKKLFRLLSGWE